MRWRRAFSATWAGMRRPRKRRRKRGGSPTNSRRAAKIMRTGNRMPISRRDILRAGMALAGGTLGGPWLRRALAQSAAGAAAPPIRMVNGADAARLHFVLRNSAAGRKYQVETLPGGLGVIDFDGDGWPDLFCTNGASLPSLAKTGPEYWNRLYRNNRDGTFSDVTEKD